LGERILSERSEPMATGQAERLIPMLEEVLAGAGVAWRDLTALGVGVGPGNFTGVRIAVAAARGLALGLGIPAHGVSGLEALAFGLPRPCLASLDARQGRLYLQGFGTENAAPQLATPDSLPDGLSAPGLTIIGHAGEMLAGRLGGKAGAQPLPLATAMALVASRRPATDTRRPAPLYLRPADAAPPREAPPVILP
jgi:tRNA threonylcarbamoyl adenosine modification protein YeaZ